MAFRIARSIVSVFQLLSANIVVKAIGLVMVAFYARYLTKEELSLVPIYTLIGSAGMVLFGFGLRPMLLRMLPSRLQEVPEQARGLIFTSSTILVAGTGLFSVGALLLASPLSVWLFESDTRVGLMRIVAIGSFFVSAREITNYLLWTASRFHRISAIQMTGAISRAVLGGSFVLLWGIKGLAIALVSVDAICLVLSLVFLRDLLKPGPVQWYPAGKLMRDSLPFYFEGFMIYFRGRGDSWIIAGALGPEAIATYFVAKRFPQMLTMMRASIDNVLTTQISKKKNRPDEISAYIPRLYELISHTMMPAIAAVAGMTPVMILIVAGAEYRGAIVPGILLCLVQLVHMYVAPVSRALFVTRRPLVRVVATAGESVVMLGLLLVLAPAFKETGVAASLLLAALVGYCISFGLLRRKLQFAFPTGQFLRSLIASVVMMAILLVGQMLDERIWVAPGIALAGVILFAIIVSLTNSIRYYQTLNSISPVQLVDPVRWLFRRPGDRS